MEVGLQPQQEVNNMAEPEPIMVEPEPVEPQPKKIEIALPVVVKAKVKQADFPGTVISHICKLSTYKDLKKFRLISRNWNRVVSANPRFCSSVVKFGRGWGHVAPTLDLTSTPNWQHVKCRHFNFIRQPYFLDYWQQTKSTVQDLRLEFVRIHCKELANLINSMPHIQSLGLVAVKIDSIHEMTTKENDGDGNMRDVTNIISCDHNRVRFEPAEPIGGKTITSLEIKQQEVPLSHCVVRILQSRCQLTNFKLERYKQDTTKFQHLEPTAESMAASLSQLLEENQETLTTFEYSFNSPSCGGLITEMARENRFPKLRLTDFTYAEANEHTNNGIRDGAYIICRNHQQRNLVNISFTLFVSAQVVINALTPILQSIASLRKFKLGLSFGNNQNRLTLQLGTLMHSIPQLEAFELDDIEYDRIESRHSWRFQERIDFSYLLHFANNIRSLTFDHYWDHGTDETIVNLLRSREIRNLTKFEIRNSWTFTDLAMSALITNLRQLEELNIINCRMLTDAGVTGLDADSCAKLMDCCCHQLMRTGFLAQANRNSLSNLTRIKKLSLNGCSRLSDVSINFAISFPELKSLDLSRCANVSDIGLNWLGQANPSLTELTIRYLHRITHFGLNHLIKTHQLMKKIRVSETSVHRKPVPSAYEEHPWFGDIVEVSREKIESPINELHRRRRRFDLW